MAEVVSQIVKGNIGDLFPLQPRCFLFDGAPLGVESTFGESSGMIVDACCNRMLSLREKDKRARGLDLFTFLLQIGS